MINVEEGGRRMRNNCPRIYSSSAEEEEEEAKLEKKKIVEEMNWQRFSVYG